MTKQEFPHWLRPCAEFLLCAGSYVLLGWLARWLAIPPGYAMAIFPPAGIALGVLLCRGAWLAPAVGLGSLLLNLSISQDHGFNPVGLALSACIACGAILQGLAGGYLLRRLGVYPAALDNNRSILMFMCAGVLSCWVNASVGVGALWLFEQVRTEQVWRNLLTWWLGDSLGVLTIAPIVLIALGEPRAVWYARRFNVLLPLLSTLVLVVLTFSFVREWEQARMQREFHELALRTSTALQARIDYHIAVQKSVATLFSSVDQINPKQFGNFVAQPISNYAALQAIVWAPRVAAANRAEFEASSHAITMLDSNSGQLLPRGNQDEYFPVQYAAPLLDNSTLVGLDLGAHPMLRQAIQEARDVGLVVASTPRNVLPRSPEQVFACLISPVFDSHATSMSVAERRQALQGVVLSVLRLEDLIDAVLSQSERQQMLLRLGTGLGNDKQHLFLNQFPASGGVPPLTFSLDLAGRDLQLQIQPAPDWQKRQHAWAAWATLVGGMLFASIVGMYLLMVSGRSWSIESLVQQRTRELHDSEQRLHLVLDHAADGILSVHDDGRILLVNRALSTQLKQSADALCQQNFSQLFAANTRQYSLLEMAEARHPIEMQGRAADGSLLPVELSVARVVQDGQMIYIVIVHDMTERKRVDQLKGDFVSAVSHELRTPLTSIRGSLGLLTGGIGGQLPEQAAKLLRLANDNAERLGLLINDLLDFEKLEYGGMRFTLSRADMRELLRQAYETNLGFAQKYGIELNLLPQPQQVLPVMVDEGRMLQILGNLLSNAIKFSQAGGSVEIAVNSSAGRVMVLVQDHGLGIADAFKPRVFEKFSQADSAGNRKYSGTGLGLALTKMMVEKMGGEIGFDSVEGQGATFFVSLPQADAGSGSS